MDDGDGDHDKDINDYGSDDNHAAGDGDGGVGLRNYRSQANATSCYIWTTPVKISINKSEQNNKNPDKKLYLNPGAMQTVEMSLGAAANILRFDENVIHF